MRKLPDQFLSQEELEAMTGTKNSKVHLEYLRERGFDPWTHMVTGEVVIYREVIEKSMGKKTNSGDGFTMDLEALNG